jgi:ABC-type polysaccharide/polyol phosphate transport system ATPase subunit
MYMRLAFSVAVAMEPDILLIDEILGVGDARFQQKCMERINEFRSSGKTIVLVSHNLDTMRELCDRLLLIHQGELLEDGPTADVIARYEELMGQIPPVAA